MISRRHALAAAAACGLGLAIGCASGGPSAAAIPACAGMTAPQLVRVEPVTLPQTYASAGIGTAVLDEIVVGPDGAVRDIRFVAASVPQLAPFAEVSLRKTRFSPAAIEGNPVAVRGPISVPVGAQKVARRAVPFDSLRVFVTGGESREARWQLAGSVARVTLVAHLGSAAPHGAAIVAIAPGGAEKTLLTIPAAPPPLEIRESVKTAGFFETAGDYRIELRSDGKALAPTTFTVAAGFETAIVNVCEPIEGPESTAPGAALPRKTGPGR